MVIKYADERDDDEFVTVPLSMLRCDECGDLLEPDGSCPIHGQLDLNLEGQPEFNGAFKSW